MSESVIYPDKRILRSLTLGERIRFVTTPAQSWPRGSIRKHVADLTVRDSKGFTWGCDCIQWQHGELYEVRRLLSGPITLTQ